MTSLSKAALDPLKTLSVRTASNRCFDWFHSGYVRREAIGISSKDMAYNPTGAVHRLETGLHERLGENPISAARFWN